MTYSAAQLGQFALEPLDALGELLETLKALIWRVADGRGRLRPGGARRRPVAARSGVGSRRRGGARRRPLLPALAEQLGVALLLVSGAALQAGHESAGDE